MINFSDIMTKFFNEKETNFFNKKETKINYSAFDIYEFIKAVRNDNVNNDHALDTCMIAERMFNDNNCY